jgi:hypothetical protein
MKELIKLDIDNDAAAMEKAAPLFDLIENLIRKHNIGPGLHELTLQFKHYGYICVNLCQKAVLQRNVCSHEFTSAFVEFVNNKTHTKDSIETYGLQSNMPTKPVSHNVSQAQASKKVIDYKTITSLDYKRFELSVKEAIRDNWVPQGGICVSLDEDKDEFYYQAMVKYA